MNRPPPQDAWTWADERAFMRSLIESEKPLDRLDHYVTLTLRSRVKDFSGALAPEAWKDEFLAQALRARAGRGHAA